MPKGRAIVPFTGTVVKSCPNWHKTAFKFHRIRCTTCFTSPDNHQKEEYHTCKTCACLIHMSWHDALALQTLLQKMEVSEHSEWLPLKERSTGVPGTIGAAGLSKRLINRKADCCPLLKRITKLKCVNSAVRTVITHPKEGCLKWLHGTMSEPPWKSH